MVILVSVFQDMSSWRHRSFRSEKNQVKIETFSVLLRAVTLDLVHCLTAHTD